MILTGPAPGRNPLFIKSEFSPGEGNEVILTGQARRNPLFIKSEFSHYAPHNKGGLKWQLVAILYSSSQNSLEKIDKYAFLACQIAGVAILYSSSQNSLGTSATPCPAWAKI